MIKRRRQVLLRFFVLLLLAIAAIGVYKLVGVEIHVDFNVRFHSHRETPEDDGPSSETTVESTVPEWVTLNESPPESLTVTDIHSSEPDERPSSAAIATTSDTVSSSSYSSARPSTHNYGSKIRKEIVTTHSYSTQRGDGNLTRNSYKMVVGILSAKRDPPTVVKMARELVARVTEGDYKFLAWISRSGAGEKDVISSLRDLHFEVHVMKENYTEVESNKIHITFNDSVERMKWRTNHVLDYANLLERALQYDSEYVLILEDDLKPAKHALDKAYQFANNQLPNRADWGSLTLYGNRYRRAPLTRVTREGSSGGCAMMIRKSIITKLIEFLRSDPYAKPIDLLLPWYLEMNHLQIYERSPNLFQHISPSSSYHGQDQSKRMTERTRSKNFVYDEDNKTLASIPSKPDGYIGCFIDYSGPERRDLSGLYAYASDGTNDRKSSPALCKTFCRDYLYYGLQNGGDCHCGNEFGMYGWAPESECNKPCQLQHSNMCGGRFRNSVYRNIDHVTLHVHKVYF